MILGQTNFLRYPNLIELSCRLPARMGAPYCEGKACLCRAQSCLGLIQGLA